MLLLKQLYTRFACTAGLLSLLLAGCNSDVFIDEFMPGNPPSVTIERADEPATVSFEADNWGLLRGGFLNDPSFGCNVWAADWDGNVLDLPFEEGQQGQVRFYDDFFSFRVEKKSRRELSAFLEENLYDHPVTVSLVVGNPYQEKQIDFTIAPGSKYRVDSVAYDWSQFFTYDYKAEWVYSLIVDNTLATDTVWVNIRPYEKAVRSVSFSISGAVMPADYYTTILGNPLPEVAIPDVEGGKPVMRDTRATFSLGEQDLPAGLDKNFSARVPVPAGKKMEVGVYVSVENYSVPFTLHCSNPDNGRTRTFSGKLASDRPYDYFYTRTDLTHTDEE